MPTRNLSVQDADPAARLLEGVELALLDHCGYAWAGSTAYGGTNQPRFVRGLAAGVYYRFESTTAGTSATTEPNWSTATSIDNTITDGNVVWTNRGRATYEFREQVTTGGQVWRIWRNRGSSPAALPNVFGQDWHFAFCRINSTELRVRCFEDWHMSNDALNPMRMIRPCAHGNANNSLTPNSNGSYGDEVAGYVLENTSAVQPYIGFTTLPTTGYEWYVHTTRNRVLMAIKGPSTDSWLQFGIFESLLTSNPAEPMPLYMQHDPPGYGVSNIQSPGSYGYAALSRHPNVLSPPQTHCFNHVFDMSPYEYVIGGIGTAVNDRYHGSVPLIGRPRLYTYTGKGSEIVGRHRGKVYDMWYVATQPTTTRTGDTVTMNGVPHVIFNSGGFGRVWVARDLY